MMNCSLLSMWEKLPNQFFIFFFHSPLLITSVGPRHKAQTAHQWLEQTVVSEDGRSSQQCCGRMLVWTGVLIFLGTGCSVYACNCGASAKTERFCIIHWHTAPPCDFTECLLATDIFGSSIAWKQDLISFEKNNSTSYVSIQFAKHCPALIKPQTLQRLCCFVHQTWPFFKLVTASHICPN